MTEHKMIQITFEGDTLLAIEHEGQNYVAIRRVCNAIGVEYGSQLKRLKQDPSAVVVDLTTTGADGKSYQMTVVDWQTVPKWLSAIRINQVAPEVREKLIRYQREVKDVLAAHFLGTTTMPVPETLPAVQARREIDLYNDEGDRDLQILIGLVKTRKEVLEVQRQQEAQWEAIKATNVLALKADDAAGKAIEVAQVAEKKAEVAQVTVQGAADFMALVGFSRLKGLRTTEQELSQEGKWFTRFCDNNGIEIRKIPHQKFGKQNAYSVEALEKHWWPSYCQKHGIDA